MNFWRKDIVADAAEQRAEAIMAKKRRKQSPGAKGLSAVAIGRQTKRSTHQRKEDRQVLTDARAHTTIKEKELEVKILNLSSNGIMIALDAAVTIGQRLQIAIEDCASITAIVRWVRDGRIGLEFAAETVIVAEPGVQDHIIRTVSRNSIQEDNPDLPLNDNRVDSARHHMVWLGKLCWKHGEMTARLRNISATGAMISVSGPCDLTSGSEVDLTLEKIGTAVAQVQWIANQQVGLKFARTFDVSNLIDEACAEVAPDDDAQGLAPRTVNIGQLDVSDIMNVRLGKVENPHFPPDMRYNKLTIDEVYATLYPGGKPKVDQSVP